MLPWHLGAVLNAVLSFPQYSNFCRETFYFTQQKWVILLCFVHPNICTGTVATFPQESHSAAALRHCWDTDSSVYGVHNKELFSLGMIKYKETPHGEGLRFIESALAVLTDEARSAPDVGSWSASPPRSCFFLSFSGPCHSYDLCDLALIWAVLPHVLCHRAEIQEGGLRAGHSPHQLLKAGALYMHPGTPATSQPVPR